MTAHNNLRKSYSGLKRKIIVGALSFGVLFWIIDSVLDYFIYYKNVYSFVSIFLLNPPEHEIYIRLTILILFVVFGIIVSKHLIKRKFVEDRLRHLNNILSAMYDINQMITAEQDPKVLANKVCNILVEKRGYNSVWILLKYENGNYIAVDTAHNENLTLFKEDIFRDKLPLCAQKAMNNSGIVITKNPVNECGNCQLIKSYTKRGGLILRLEYNKEFFGFISVSLLPDILSDKDEHMLFTQVAKDISVVLFNIGLAQKKEMENKLLEVSEYKYKSLFNNLNAAAALHEIVLDDEGAPIDFIILEVNSRYETITKLKAIDIQGKRGTKVIPNLEKKWIEIYGEIALTGKSKTIIDHSEYLDKYWEVRIYSPKKNQFAIILMDITERMKAEKDLIESEKLLNDAQKIANLGHYIFNIQTGLWTSSIHLDSIFGIDESFVKSAEGWLHLVHPDDSEMMGDYLQNYVIAQHNKFDKQYRIVDQKTGEVKWVHGLGYLDYDENNNPVKMFGTIQDITVLYETEQKLRENEEKLSTLFGSMTEMVVLHEIVLDDKGQPVNYKIIDCNKAFTDITGITKETAVGNLATDVFQTDEAPYLDEYAKVALTGKSHSYTTFFSPMDKYFNISAVSPKIGQFATITTDITELKQVEEVISSKNEELENYLYVASHDLRSPLVNIQGFSLRLEEITGTCKSLIDEIQLPDEFEDKFNDLFEDKIPQTLNFIYGGVEKMDKLINGLLKISRTGRMTMSVKKVDMNSLIEDVLNNLAYEINEFGAVIKYESLPYCFGDYDLLYQLFANLITNSLKYRHNKRKPVILVRGEVKYKNVLYLVEDNGIGIEERHLSKIWDVFFQVNPKAVVAGDGIGLSIVKRIIDKHRGKVSVESTVGQSTVFGIELKREMFNE